MSRIDFTTAELLAADLSGGRVDPNEAQKVLAYARSKQSGRALFDYLRAVLADGQAVIRSKQTLDYYREIQGACDRHLRSFRDDDQRVLQTFAWSLRLLRYYKLVPEAAQRRSVETTATSPVAAVALPTPAVPPVVRPTGQALLEGGAVFTGKILDIDSESGDVAIEVPGFTLDKALGRIKAENLSGKKFKLGNSARVEVISSRTLKNGRVVLELRPAAKPEGV